jgi:hypothetical protein
MAALTTAPFTSMPTAVPCAALHAHGFRWRTLLVGLMQSMAGSAALLVLTVSQAPTPAAGLFYVALWDRLNDRHGNYGDTH